MAVADDMRVTLLLRAWREGDPAALDKVMPIIYDELRKLAASYLRRERKGQTLRPTELVAEAYVRLSSGATPEWNDRSHFYGIAARVMRQILVDHARRRSTGKRGSGQRPITFDDNLTAAPRPEELIALDNALEALATVDARKAQVIEMHYFGGLSQPEIGEALDISVATVARDLRFAEAWIHRHLRGTSDPDDATR